jgi:hypothetical protein
MTNQFDNLVQDFALHPEKWNALPLADEGGTQIRCKTYIAKQCGTTVEKFEELIAKAAEMHKFQRKLALQPVDTRNAKNIVWLFTGRFPAGMLVILDGDPGLSKSMFSLALSVSVLTGKPFLGMIKPETTGGVILMSAEDDLENTIIPRLLAAGAPHGVIPNLFHIPCSKPNGDRVSLSDPVVLLELEDLIKASGARLLIVDPINAYLGDKVDSHNDQKIRQVLGPISELANRTGCMILCLRHLNKGGGGKAIYRGLGSIGYTGQARANFFAAEHPDEEGTFVVATSKFNIGAKPSSIKYKLDFSQVPGVSSLVPYCAHGENCDINANTLSEQSVDAEETGKLKDAVDFLIELLRLGPVKAQEGNKQARKMSISDATLSRARRKLRVKAIQTATCWYWQMPDETKKASDTESPVTAEKPF